MRAGCRRLARLRTVSTPARVVAVGSRRLTPVLATVGDLVDDIVVRLGGPINVASDTEAVIERRRGGSAANVAAVAARISGRSRFLGQVGDDARGAALLAELAAEGVDVSMVAASAGALDRSSFWSTRAASARSSPIPAIGTRSRRSAAGVARRRRRPARPALLAGRRRDRDDVATLVELGARAGDRGVDRSVVGGGDRGDRRR